jgi:hypothetical protein
VGVARAANLAALLRRALGLGSLAAPPSGLFSIHSLLLLIISLVVWPS